MSDATRMTRRTFGALAGASTALLLPRSLQAANRPDIRKFSGPRRAKNAEHAIVYRRENEFASHPYVRGFWETAAGHLISNFSVATVDYHGDPNLLAHISLVRNAGGRRAVTVKSEDRGRTCGKGAARRKRSARKDFPLPRGPTITTSTLAVR